MPQIKERILKIKEELKNGNSLGESVFLVAATKMQTAELINQAIEAGVDAVAENKVQEFRDKEASLKPCPRHFIGHLQTNKVKYLVGKIDLFHSLDRDALVEELSKQSVKAGVVSNILLQINVGNEDSKGGYAYEEAKEVFLRVCQTEGLRVQGFMAMLPAEGTQSYLGSLVDKMRALYDWARTQSKEVCYLSMGMSGDYSLCVAHGSNMIRVGSTIFGARQYGERV